MTTPTPDPILQACQQVAQHANVAGLSLQEFARAMNNLPAKSVDTNGITAPQQEPQP